MTQITLPFSIAYNTAGTTSVSDIIEALQATDELMKEAISLLPSLFDGLQIEASSLNVRALTQESPLREAFFVALMVTFQDELRAEVPPMLEDLFHVSINDKYDTIVTVVFLIVVFYGVSLAKDLLQKSLENHKPRQMLKELIAEAALQTGKSERDIANILEAKFAKPGPVKKLLTGAKRFFIPSQKAGNASIYVDRHLIGTEVVREVPYPSGTETPSDFDRYTPVQDVKLKIHAMDQDRGATGWAAVAEGISDKRLKMRIMEPLSAADLFGKVEIVGDIVVVSKLTANGFTPSEIQLTAF